MFSLRKAIQKSLTASRLDSLGLYVEGYQYGPKWEFLPKFEQTKNIKKFHCSIIWLWNLYFFIQNQCQEWTGTFRKHSQRFLTKLDIINTSNDFINTFLVIDWLIRCDLASQCDEAKIWANKKYKKISLLNHLAMKPVFLYPKSMPRMNWYF